MNKVLHKLLVIIFIVFSATMLFSCATAPPHHPNNICSIFRQYPKWFWSTQDVQKHWGVPISVVMAIILQESHYRADAKPPRKKLLWIIPWLRPTSAYGYSQATDGSWRSYKRSTGTSGASRDAFHDAANFIGWYANLAHRKLGISTQDPYRVYLAYHEGIGGYAHKTYLRKRWLIGVAHRVDRNAWLYHRQLMGCIHSLKTRPWWHLWSY